MIEEKVVSIDTKLEDQNLFDNLDSLKIDQNYADQIGVKKQITTIPCKRPNKQDWVAVHPDQAYSLQTAFLELTQDREHYIVIPELWPLWQSEIIPKMLYTAMNRQGVLFLWPVRLPDETGRLDNWNESAHKAAAIGMKKWIRVVSNRSLGAYEVLTPTGKLEAPKWPDMEFKAMLKIAFEDRVINSEDHPVIKALYGVE